VLFLKTARNIRKNYTSPVSRWSNTGGWNSAILWSDLVGNKAAQRSDLLDPSLTGEAVCPSQTVCCCTCSSSVLSWTMHVRSAGLLPLATSGGHKALQYKCLLVTTNTTWYVSNRQIQEDIGIRLLADYISVIIASFDSKLADVGNPLLRPIGWRLRRTSIDSGHQCITEANWCSVCQSRLFLKLSQVGTMSCF
jgi:hypothetical protein